MLVTRSRRDMPVPWEMANVRNRIRQILDTPFEMELFPTPVGWTPPVEVTETADELVLTAELPGMGPGDIEITLENDVLTLRGEKKEEKVEEKPELKYHVVERTYGAFTRSFTLPREVDGEKIRAQFNNGVLTLFLPKTERAKGRKIEIAAS